MPLSEAAVHGAKPGEKAVRLFDERGLFLLVAPSGGKWWRLKYRFNGREKSISLGVYPDVSLEEARRRRDEARALLASGIDPSEARKAAAAETRAKAQSGPVSLAVTADPEGMVHIRKGRALVCLSRDEARFCNDILSRLLGGSTCP